MVSFSNGGSSGDVSSKRPLENGYLPKYKPRRVSAHRDFPPNCGHNDVPMNVKPEENGNPSALIMETEDVINSEMSKGLMTDVVRICESTNPAGTMVIGNPEINDINNVNEIQIAKLPGPTKLDTSKYCEIANVADPGGIKNSNSEANVQSYQEIDRTMDVYTEESLDALVGKVTATANVVEKSMMEIGAPVIQLPHKVELRILEATDNPIAVERYELSDDSAGKVATTMLNGFPNDVKSDSSKNCCKAGGQTTTTEFTEVNGLNLDQKSGVQDAQPMSDADVPIIEVRISSQSLSSPCSTITPETSVRIKDEYRWRRVSAIRDFPPHCGRSNALPSAEEKQIVTSRNDSLFGTQKVQMKLMENVSQNGSGDGLLGEMLMTSHKGHVDGVDKVHAKEQSTEILDDGVVRGFAVGNASSIVSQDTVKATAEVALPMDSEENGGLQCSNIDQVEARQDVPGAGTASKARIDHKIEDTAKSEGTDLLVHSPIENDTVSPLDGSSASGNEYYIEIVQGLMAAPYCPWRNGKLSSNNSDGSRKVARKDLSQEQKSKAFTSNRNFMAECSGGTSPKMVIPLSYHADNSCSPIFIGKEDYGTDGGCLPDISAEPVGKEIVVYVHKSVDEEDTDVMHGLIDAPCSSLAEGEVGSIKSDGESSKGNVSTEQNLNWRKKAKAVARKSNPKGRRSGAPLVKQKGTSISSKAEKNPGAVILAAEEGYDDVEDLPTDSPASHKLQNFDVSLPPFGPSKASHGDARNRVRETLRLFHTICRKLLQKEEANSTPEKEGKSQQSGKKAPFRIDLQAAKVIKERRKEINTEKQILGQVPGVEVGDEFQYRVELAVVGIHRLYQAGIDCTKVNGQPVAASIVATGAYANDMENGDVLIYCGQGGNAVRKTKQPEDQKLERGNLALRNSISAGTPVRVVRGWKETKAVDPLDSKPKMVTTYVYDGLYTVKNYWTEKGAHGKQIFMFELRRIPGQPELAWKELKKSHKSKVRPGVCVTDISGGKERLPISAVNTLDDEKPPPFNYISKMMYPDWYHPNPPVGCDCTGRCFDSKKCRCSGRNGGEIPYNRNGAIVEVKPLVYECGPSCKCPPSCYNRVSQLGIRFLLEIFKTESRGWGVRSLNSIPSGSFICEYVGELLEEKEAEQRIGNDEYLFDIGQNYSDLNMNLEEQSIPFEVLEEGGYTIDAAQYGNIGRFINHSCSPNLYAQNVIYDHDDKRMPHVMLFAAENIPPLQELTYHYNYTLDQPQLP